MHRGRQFFQIINHYICQRKSEVYFVMKQANAHTLAMEAVLSSIELHKQSRRDVTPRAVRADLPQRALQTNHYYCAMVTAPYKRTVW